MVVALRRTFVIGVPLGLAAAVSFHPEGGPHVFADVHHDVGAWIAVHTILLFGFPLLAIAAYLVLIGVNSRAATVSRLALVPFLAFYTAWETTIGLGNGILVDYANGLPADEQAVVSEAIQDYSSNRIVGETSIAVIIGSLGWLVSMVAAAVALRRAGAGWPAAALLGLSGLFVLHPPPIGPVALVSFAAGAAFVEAWRSRHRAEAVMKPTTPVPTGPLTSSVPK
jgi:hypothetical protein